MRLQAAQPIAQSCHDIQLALYQPAVTTWLTMVKDIPDAPTQLETNMKKIIQRSYNGTAANLPCTFQFILVLPVNQGYYKQVAYSCIRREMRAHGHQYIANPNANANVNANTDVSPSPLRSSTPTPERGPYYNYNRYK